MQPASCPLLQSHQRVTFKQFNQIDTSIKKAFRNSVIHKKRNVKSSKLQSKLLTRRVPKYADNLLLSYDIRASYSKLLKAQKRRPHNSYRNEVTIKLVLT
jgi:hypothetical protein